MVFFSRLIQQAATKIAFISVALMFLARCIVGSMTDSSNIDELFSLVIIFLFVSNFNCSPPYIILPFIPLDSSAAKANLFEVITCRARFPIFFKIDNLKNQISNKNVTDEGCSDTKDTSVTVIER